MGIKFIIRKSKKTILTVGFKEPRRSIYGELDIMIDSAKSIPFENVIAGNYYMKLEKNIHAISWHGYYQKRDKSNINIPTIHFKDEYNKYKHYKSPSHHGTINSDELFSFPICSLYIPQGDDWINSVNESIYTVGKTEYYVKDVDNTASQRIDIFVTPKNVSAAKILESELGYIYKMADVEIFNSEEGLFKPINESIGPSVVDYSKYISIYKLSNGHELIIRTLGNKEHKFNELENAYSLLVHDPNDAYNRITNRNVAKYDENTGEMLNVSILKDDLKNVDLSAINRI